MARTATTLNPIQRRALDAVRLAHGDLMASRHDMKIEVMMEVQRRLAQKEIAESRAMNEALALGIPKTMIAAAVGTSNWNTLSEKYALTAHEFTAEKVAERAESARGPQFEHDAWAGRLTVNWWEDAAGTIHEEGATLTATPIEGGWFGLPFVVITPGPLNAFEQYLRDDFEWVTGEDWADDRARANPDNASEVARLHLAVADWWKEQGK